MSLGRCPYFSYHAEAAERLDADDGSHAAPAINMFPFCTHRHSPAPPSVVLFSPGGSDLLKCGGDLSKCQVARDVRLDLLPGHH